MESQTIELGATALAASQALVPPGGLTLLTWVAFMLALTALIERTAPDRAGRGPAAREMAPFTAQLGQALTCPD